MSFGLPKIDFDIGHTVHEFLGLLRSIETKLEELIELHRAASPTVCGICERDGLLRCPAHGPVRVPEAGS